jgi:hypothetical protein
MDKNRLMVLVAAVVTTLAESEGCPESTLYLICGSDMDRWNTLRHVLTNGGWVRILNHYVTLTEDGRTLAESINARIG